jgi:ring-1,2-phenylacetyl-CoA epoxidase subunit PaaC
MTPSTQTALKTLLFSMADDCLIIGHRNSEWVGLGPVLEEDIAFASIAQDKLGHALALYTILHEHLGEQDPDTLAFMRSEKQFTCCRFVELPIGDYDFSLMRHFLFDTAEKLRFDMLTESAFTPIQQIARKARGEIMYHTMHANVWIQQLGKGSDEANARLQAALNQAFPFALGMFEPSKYEAILQSENLFGGEETLKTRWLATIAPIIEASGLKMPSAADASNDAEFGGRYGYHTEYLSPLLEEMSEVFVIDPLAEW